MGAEAIKDMLNRLKLDELSYELRNQAANETSQQRKSEALKRLRVVEAFRQVFSPCVSFPDGTPLLHEGV